MTQNETPFDKVEAGDKIDTSASMGPDTETIAKKQNGFIVIEGGNEMSEREFNDMFDSIRGWELTE